MPKRKSIKLLFKVVIAIVALFSATAVMAFSDFGDPPVDSFTNSGWTVALLSQQQLDNGWWKWNYRAKDANGNFKGINYLAMLIPDCCNGEIKVDVTSPESRGFKWVYDVGLGESTNRFGAYNQQAFVVKGTPDSSIDWFLITNTPVKTSSTILLSVKSLGPLTYEMAVPGCGGTYTAVATEEEMTIKSVRIRILRAPGTGCGTGLQIWNSVSEEWTDVVPSDLPTIDGVPVVECSETRGKSGCQECIFTAAASPGWTYINLGGTWYKVYIP
jgi:hypothetical protein